MQDFIDVDIIIDPRTLLNLGTSDTQDPGSPYSVTDGLYAITQPTSAAAGQASARLTLKAIVGNVIRWRMNSLSGISGHSSVLYSIQLSKGVATLGQATGNINIASAPFPILQPDGQDYNPLRLTLHSQHDYFLQSDVVGHGSGEYLLSFCIVDAVKDDQSAIMGYFSWSTSIQVA